MFEIKKLIASFLSPFPIFLVFMTLAIFLWQRGNLRRSKIFFAISFSWIILFSYPPFSALLLKPLESTYPKVHLSAPYPKYIHVLGNGHISNRNLPLSSELGRISLMRVNEGVAIYKSHPNMKLIFSGYGGDDPISNARMNREMAIVLGVNPNDIILLEAPKDTREEAIAAKKVVGNEPLILVTSASHMVRASALFRKNGVRVIEAPTDFQIKQDDSLWQFPSAEGLSRSESVFHEYIGLIWSKLRGYI